ncbi:DedA family protein [Brevibacterium oceani]|uniref:DedA family protein n=1 Tax=Brevibacterium oceani TaxID=358099 RepID=UPI00215A0C59|nr:VTT domain-containing protein [Brevibacterium oceani]
MNPLEWSFPIAVTWLILFGIILARAGGTFLLGRLARTGIRKIERVDRLMSGPKYRKAESMIERFGAPVIAVSFIMIGVQTVLNLAAGTTGMSYRRYIPALAVGGAMWATIYSTVGLIGFKALAAGYQAAPGLTIGVAVCFVLAIAGLVIGLKKPRASAEETDGAETEPALGDDTGSAHTGSAHNGGSRTNGTLIDGTLMDGTSTHGVRADESRTDAKTTEA